MTVSLLLLGRNENNVSVQMQKDCFVKSPVIGVAAGWPEWPSACEHISQGLSGPVAGPLSCHQNSPLQHTWFLERMHVWGRLGAVVQSAHSPTDEPNINAVNAVEAVQSRKLNESQQKHSGCVDKEMLI